jgi:hypothetical protein
MWPDLVLRHTWDGRWLGAALSLAAAWTGSRYLDGRRVAAIPARPGRRPRLGASARLGRSIVKSFYPIRKVDLFYRRIPLYIVQVPLS